MDVTAMYQGKLSHEQGQELGEVSEEVIVGEYVQRVVCQLEEDDEQCGHIFFNEMTRVLKFFCTYCRETYDNINYYCDHLSEHINEDNAGCEENPRFPIDTEEQLCRTMGYATDVADSFEYDKVCEAAQEYSGAEITIAEETEDGDRSDEIAAEVREEMRRVISDDNTFIEENSCSDDFLGYDDEEDVVIVEAGTIIEERQTPAVALKKQYISESEMKKIYQTATDFESMIDATSINEEIPKSSLLAEGAARRKRGKKVTTVKVIAIKNRIAELYERIKTEEEKRSQLLDAAGSSDNLMPAITINSDTEELPEQADTSTESLEDVSSVPVQRKIIGETLITLLPGVSKPPATYQQSSNTTTFSQSIKQHRRECVCPACGLSFRSSFSLSIHKRTHYLESKSSIKLAHKCSDCNQLFNRISELKDHLQEVHYPEGFICKICSKKLTSLTLLEKHMRAVHLNRPFSCKICQKSFDSRSGFEAHVDTHIEGQNNYKCRVCGRKYSTEPALNHHLRNHKEQKPQCCVVCGKLTLRITQHMKIHTPRPKRILSCSACGKVFNFSSGLSQHFKVMHKFPRPLPKPKREAGALNSNKRKRKPRNVPQQQKHNEAEQEDLGLEQEQQHLQVDEEVHAKEEEAKRVIVELIQNASYTSSAFFPDNHHLNGFEVTAPPPIAREETISAVNSIVNDC